MAGVDGAALREWRREQGWDVPELARQLRHAAGEPLAAELPGMIRRWERGDHELSERYELLYRKLGWRPPVNGTAVSTPAAEVARRAEALPGPEVIAAMEAGALAAGTADPAAVRAAAADAVAKVRHAHEAMIRLAALLAAEEADDG